MCYTTGYLLRDDREGVVVSSEVSHDGRIDRVRWEIPRAYIQDMRELRRARKKTK